MNRRGFVVAPLDIGRFGDEKTAVRVDIVVPYPSAEPPMSEFISLGHRTAS